MQGRRSCRTPCRASRDAADTRRPASRYGAGNLELWRTETRRAEERGQREAERKRRAKAPGWRRRPRPSAGTARRRRRTQRESPERRGGVSRKPRCQPWRAPSPSPARRDPSLHRPRRRRTPHTPRQRATRQGIPRSTGSDASCQSDGSTADGATATQRVLREQTQRAAPSIILPCFIRMSPIAFIISPCIWSIWLRVFGSI